MYNKKQSVHEVALDIHRTLFIEESSADAEALVAYATSMLPNGTPDEVCHLMLAARKRHLNGT